MAKRAHSRSPSATRGGGVLVVDDNEEALEIIALELKPLNVEVRTAISAELALELLAAGRPDVLITDHHMPGMKGAELCMRVRADATMATTYVLMLTGDEDTDGLQNIGRGADEYLTKPYTARGLRASVKAGLRAQAHRRVMARRERRRAIEWLANVVAHEINNPLTVALSTVQCVQQIASEGVPSGEDLAEMREMLDEARTELTRLQAMSRRLSARKAPLTSGTPTQVDVDELLETLDCQLEPLLGDRFSLHMEKNSDESGFFDRTLLASAVRQVVAAAAKLCSGEASVSVHLDTARIAVLIEFSGAPSADPESILEPRLEAKDGRPATFDPGLSGLESSFANHGGQIFARPTGASWRFGITLPMAKPLAEVA